MSTTLTQQQIDQMIQAQIGANPTAALPSNADIAAALQNYATSATAVAAALNANLESTYLTGFNNWAAQVTAGKVSNANPPQPPAGYIAATATDGWTYVVMGVDPVCAVPPIPQVATTPTGMVVAIGAHQSGKYWAQLPTNANVPGGYTTPGTSSDGVSGLWQYVAYPFGGWWLKVG
jgi:hypothetical protein